MELSLHVFTHWLDAMALGGISSLYINMGSVLELNILIVLESLSILLEYKKENEKKKGNEKKEKKKIRKEKK